MMVTENLRGKIALIKYNILYKYDIQDYLKLLTTLDTVFVGHALLHL